MRHRFFEFLAKFSSRRPWLVVIAAILLTSASVYYAATTLTLNADLDDLVSEDLEYHKKYKDYLKEFGDQEYLYVVVEIQDNLPQAKRFLRDLARRLSGIGDVREIIYKIENPAMEKGFCSIYPRKI